MTREIKGALFCRNAVLWIFSNQVTKSTWCVALESQRRMMIQQGKQPLDVVHKVTASGEKDRNLVQELLIVDKWRSRCRSDKCSYGWRTSVWRKLENLPSYKNTCYMDAFMTDMFWKCVSINGAMESWQKFGGPCVCKQRFFYRIYSKEKERKKARQVSSIKRKEYPTANLLSNHIYFYIKNLFGTAIIMPP